MKIHYDGFIYMLQEAGGVNRYFTNLIQRLPDSFLPVLTVYRQRDKNLPSHANLKVTRYEVFRPTKLCSALRPLFFRAVNAVERYDLAHPTYYSLLTGKPLGDYKCPVVVTVYDFMLEMFKEQLDPTGSNALIKRDAIMAADAIICISENTKRDLLARFPVPESRVFVTPLASDIAPSLIREADAVPERPYFLYVGGRQGYKNFAGLLESFAPVSAKHPDVVLCVAGGEFTEAEQQAIAAAGLSAKVQHVGLANDAQLAKLYTHSIALVYPSLYEGFGIPPLEAMSCGAPVIACNSSSIPEVVGDAGLLFRPDAPGELSELLELVIAEPALRDRLIRSGRERAQMFSWDRTAAQTVAVYQTLL